MSNFIRFSNKEIQKSLEGVTRQYFVGNLKREQKLPFIIRDDIEVGITSYDTFNNELPHKHSVATEFQYVLSGRTVYYDLDLKKEFEFKQGDFYIINKNTSYAQKSKPSTKILFIKTPSISDKEIVEVNEELKVWLDERLKTIRKDYFYEENSPMVNSIKPASAVAIIDSDKILLLKRSDNKKWTMPGGTLEYGESLVECAIREVMEETGYNIKVTDIIGTYTDPNIKIEYSDGEVRQEFTIVYKGEVLNGEISIDSESTEYCWIDINEIEKLDLVDSQKARLKDVKRYLEEGKRRFK